MPPSRNVVDFATPYDIMVGLWAGVAITYDAEGNYLWSACSTVAAYWKRHSELMHFREDEQRLGEETLKSHPYRAAVADLTRFEYDLNIRGKHCDGASSILKLVGTQTRPDAYSMHLTSKAGQWFNNHICTTPNERHVIGPFVAVGTNGKIPPNGKVVLTIAQTYTRVSYDIPKEFKRKRPQV